VLKSFIGTDAVVMVSSVGARVVCVKVKNDGKLTTVNDVLKTKDDGELIIPKDVGR